MTELKPPGKPFRTLESLSFVHSAIYICLLLAALGVRELEPAKNVLGWAHGIMWIAMSLLCLVALRARVISLWLTVCVVVIGGLGPFVGTIAFVIEGRRRLQARADDQAQPGPSD